MVLYKELGDEVSTSNLEGGEAGLVYDGRLVDGSGGGLGPAPAAEESGARGRLIRHVCLW